LSTKKLEGYGSEIVLKVISQGGTYRFMYSLNNGGSFQPVEEIPANPILSRKYTGAYLGLYSSSNGQKTKAYADFDWVMYQGYQKTETK
jgi:alpha-N-arabinofuranosidase